MTTIEPYNLITILGPTATGKTRFASELAYEINGEIISADSRQVYRGMNLGTGKDYDDYEVNACKIPYHLVDTHEAGYKYNVYEFQSDFFDVFDMIQKKMKFPILCGGTGMYIESVLKEYKLTSVPVNQVLRDSLKNKTLDELGLILSKYKKLHNQSDTDTIKRAIRAIEIADYYSKNDIIEEPKQKINSLMLGIKFDRDTRRSRITERLKIRLRSGMIEEVQKLLDSGVSKDDLIYYGLEYKFITLYLCGELGFEEMSEKLNTAIHQFAKRQMTWFRKMERDGHNIHWIDGSIENSEKIKLVKMLLEKGLEQSNR